MAGPNAITNGARFQPPPSSMIATHVINGRGQTNISRDDFAHLLQESLGTDDQGQPNLGRDVLVNLKLLVVIARLGIEPFVSTSKDDPFRKKIDQGKNLSELKCCLDVIALAVRQTPEIVFEDVEPLVDTKTGSSNVYAWLLPIILAIITRSSDVEVRSKCAEVLDLCLIADVDCSYHACSSVAEYMKDVVVGTWCSVSLLSCC